MTDQPSREEQFVKPTKPIRGLCLTSLCIVAVFAAGAAGSASAALLLFIPHNGKLPYHIVGKGGPTSLETVNGLKLSSSEYHWLLLALSTTLPHVDIVLLKTRVSSGEECQNAGAGTGTVKTGLLLGHLGFADHEGTERPAILILLGKIHFFCKLPLIGNQLVLIRGGLIGEIASPKLNIASEELLIALVQHAGVQLLRSILFGTELVAAAPELSTNEGAFEAVGQEGNVTLKALKGEGTFLLVSP